MAASGSVVCIAAAGTTAEVLAGLPSAEGVPAFSRAQFERLIHSKFFGVGDSGSFNLELLSIEDGPDSPGLEQFSLDFKSSTTDLPSGAYEIAYNLDGRLHGQAIYLDAAVDESAGSVAASNRYRATFSLLT